MVSITLRAIPVPDRSILHVFVLVATARTELARREVPGNDNDLLAVPLWLIFQHRPKLRPWCFRYSFGKLLVFHHAGCMQIFDADDVVVFDDFSRNLLQVIRSSIADSFMNPGDFDALVSGSFSIRTVFRPSFLACLARRERIFCSLASFRSSFWKNRGFS